MVSRCSLGLSWTNGMADAWGRTDRRVGKKQTCPKTVRTEETHQRESIEHSRFVETRSRNVMNGRKFAKEETSKKKNKQ